MKNYVLVTLNLRMVGATTLYQRGGGWTKRPVRNPEAYLKGQRLLGSIRLALRRLGATDGPAKILVPERFWLELQATQAIAEAAIEGFNASQSDHRIIDKTINTYLGVAGELPVHVRQRLEFINAL